MEQSTYVLREDYAEDVEREIALRSTVSHSDGEEGAL